MHELFVAVPSCLGATQVAIELPTASTASACYCNDKLVIDKLKATWGSIFKLYLSLLQRRQH